MNKKVIQLIPFFLGSILLLNPIRIDCQELSSAQLRELTLDSLQKLESQLEYGSSYLTEVLNVRIQKAKISGDSLELFRAYNKSAWNSPFEEGLKYCDSMEIIANNVNNYAQNSRSHYVKGVIYYENNYPELALDELITSYNFGQLADSPEDEVDAINVIAALKREYGEEEEAILLQKESLKLLKKNKEKFLYYDLTYLITLDNIARCFAQVKKLDSARVYAREGMEMALRLNDTDVHMGLSILDAQLNFYDNNFIKARDSLLKYNDLIQGTSKADLLFYLGATEAKLGNHEQKIAYFKEIDSILEKEGFPIIDNIEEIYQELTKDALNNGAQELGRIHMDRLVYYDSLVSATRSRIRNVTLREFDIPFQEREITKSRIEVSKKGKALIILYFLSFFTFLGFIFYFLRYRKMKMQFQKIMREEIKPNSRLNESNQIHKINIDQSVVKSTLLKLDQWELEHGYLDNTIDQNKLASTLETNSTYLSKIINVYKNQNFSNYLKDLRISYAINFIKKNPDIVKTHSLIQIAEQFGFNSIDVFVRAFKAKAGITPASFIKQLKKSNL